MNGLSSKQLIAPPRILAEKSSENIQPSKLEDLEMKCVGMFHLVKENKIYVHRSSVAFQLWTLPKMDG